MKKSITLIAILICFATIGWAENENKNNEGILLAPQSTTGLNAPVATAAANIRSTSFTANWNDVQGATSYLLRVVDNQTQDFVIKDVESQTLTYWVTGLLPNHSYSFAVKASDANGMSGISNWIDVNTLRSGPVTNAASNIRSTSFTASWNDVEGATSFLLRVTDDQTQEFVVDDLELQAFSYELTGLKPNCIYTYSVIAKFPNNEITDLGNWVKISTLRSGPVANAATKISATSFTANWEDVQGATSFLLRVTDDQTQEFIVKDLELQAFSHEMTGLKPNSTYSYSVLAKFPNNEVTDLSNWVEVKTKSQTGIADNKLKLDVHPNPATDFVTIRGIEKGSEIKLISTTGSLVKRSIAQSYNAELMLQDVQKGIYFVVVDGNNNRKIQRITIE